MEVPNLTRTLQAFCDGKETIGELLIAVDQALVSGVGTGELLIQLADSPLQPEILEALRRRIVKHKKSKRNYADTIIFEDEPEDEQTGIATRSAKERSGNHTSKSIPEEATRNLTTDQDSKSDNRRTPIRKSAASVRNREARNGAADLDSKNNVSPAAPNKELHAEGDTLDDRFELIKWVGSGGMSTVYKAVDRHRLKGNYPSPYVAVKILNRKLRANARALMAFEQEAKKCEDLTHPNIVQVYGFLRGPSPYIVMEYLSGETLADKISRLEHKGMPFNSVVRIINKAGAALRFMHERGILHRDFKPENVFLEDTAEVKVIDFGIARALSSEPEAAANPDFVRAMTPNYASPQMLEHAEADQRDDVYALACTAYELLTGQRPFGQKLATEARDARLEPKRPEALTHKQWNALQRALKFDRRSRTPSVAQFLQDINEQRPQWMVPASIAAGILVLISVLAGFIFLKRPVEMIVEGQPEIESSIALGDTQTIGLAAHEPELRPGLLQSQSELKPAAASKDEWLADRDSEQQVELQREQVAQIDVMLPPPADTKIEAQGGVNVPIDPLVQDLEPIEDSTATDRLSTSARDTGRETPPVVEKKAEKPTAAKPPIHETVRESVDIAVARLQTPVPTRPIQELSPVRTEIQFVKHQVGQSDKPSNVSIQAGITGPVQRMEVFIATDQGFSPHPMYDDGTNGDPIAGDGTHQAEISLIDPSRPTRYYVAAYPQEGTVIYSPTRAETESYVVEPIRIVAEEPRAPVVINELMASNEQTIYDPQGDYDDWIELHNTTPDAIDLSGYYLTDSPDEPRQWRFPDGTIIPAHGYLIVWADGDASYSNITANAYELHASFELDRRGEQILLIDADGRGNAVVDSVSFDRLRSDVSYARISSHEDAFRTVTWATPGRAN